MRPSRCAFIVGSTAFIIVKKPNTLSRNCRSRISSVVLSTVPRKCVPALLTRMSMRSNVCSTVSMNFLTAFSSVTSVGTPSTRPFFDNSATAASSCAALRLQIATAQPSSRSTCATALPIPREPPVTTATLPLKPSCIAFLVFLLHCRRERYSMLPLRASTGDYDGFGHQRPPRDRHRRLEWHRFRDGATVPRRRRARADHRTQPAKARQGARRIGQAHRRRGVRRRCRYDKRIRHRENGGDGKTKNG